MLTLYHGGQLNAGRTRLWLTGDFEYAACYAEMYCLDHVWALTLDLRPSDILDVIAYGLDARAVAAALVVAAIPAASILDDEIDRPPCALDGVPNAAIRAAGYRAVRLWEQVDWGHPVHTGPKVRRTVSLCLVDLTAIVCRVAIALPAENFQTQTTDKRLAQGLRAQ